MSYKYLMQQSFEANQNLKNEWRNWQNGKINSKTGTEPQSVTDARNLFFEKNDLLYGLKLEPLEREFKKNPQRALDEVIEFLSVEIMAFRCGYAKEVFLQWLKQIEFSQKEIEKLRDLILNICQSKSFRREFRRWCRLAVKIADKNFVLRLQNLSETENKFAMVKSKWILEMIKQNRVDLR